MNECPYPSPVLPRREVGDPSRNDIASTPPARPSRHCRYRHRHTAMTMMEYDDGNEIFGDPIKCTGKCCKSCSAGLIADCVAVCCCPCVVVNILAFAFLKVPWMVGRRILKLGRNNKKKKKKKGQNDSHRKCLEWECGGELDGITRKGSRPSLSRRDETGAFSEFGFPGFEEEELKNGNFSARFEAEQQLWFELHQVGHLGFGRVSFTGIPIPCS